VLKEYVPGARIVLTRHDRWWGPRLPWSEVHLRIATDDGARLASLLAGELDIIEALPSQGAERVSADPRFHVIGGISGRIVYLGFDHLRDDTPFVAGPDGAKLGRNPLKDARVRQAISLAINQQALHERVMEGKSVIASQFLPNGRFGTSDALKPSPYDPDRARALLKEAGYPNGFRLTVLGPNDRFINDAKIVQAVAQFLTRIGIQTQAEAGPWSVYTKRTAQREFSFYLASWGVNTGETSNPLKAVLATYDRAAGMGAANGGRYSNPEVDKRLAEALQTMDDAKRGSLLAEASRIAFEDVAIIPLHHEVAVWAARQGITYETRADQYTLAMGVGQKG
jgi:peptide/nickel transport system substrate-binding protein